ncbi:MAG: UvrD-helicase domain-containing protein, partial [Lachnospiraceae bacterium]|nr:UvrD-helicase domain-containing protein [Lachnospiraceae bacterium]
MEELRLNDAQKSAIEKQGSNILVSAAAGSGKTTVLVERVLKKIIEDRISIDDLIIMTFTRAAASSMKEKIHTRIRKAIADSADDAALNEHLRRQLMKTHSARICTIDSLCLDIVRDHFQYLDLDPTFRIADEAELRMLQADVLQAFLEEKYQDPDEDFLTFVSYYTDKSDVKIESLIQSL